ncbi:alpha/beta-hydrolase [Aspergillus saccharolyticus JOP 1030-1]|uniref:Alpha/beta-hydrolase n=1 Tax=Aspergillus saccharolyticus JOP 1030-1 TaxID=1450539 RepID=A0A318Z6H3_9EURO|nr:alpha/beta-hydrolase [Aspergillus saccharolyticus JOP 1030-1]PYH40383.1 alpha/beta-hydrolase [Aspergillus saccharolyticus JOP 1030-1]
MAEIQPHADFLTSCQENRKKAMNYIQFRSALSPEDPKARFPGFRQGLTTFKAGQQVEKGAKPLPVDILMHESMPMVLSDGTKLYYDIFFPAGYENLEVVDKYKKIPALVAWSPYGKQKGGTLLDDFPFRAGVPKHWLSGLQKWEGPDPGFWCAEGYAIVNVDTRGAYTSEGDLEIMGYQEAQDGAEFVTWLSEQPWCNGKVGLTGNSWLAMIQWKIGSLRPKGLEALAPWEGIQDMYRDNTCQGGIPAGEFHNSIADTLASYGKLEDPPSVLVKYPLFTEYWEDKRANCEQINVPTYVAASWTNPIHTPGTLRAYRCIPESVPKWLRVHNSQEWPDYYADSSCRDLKRFFDYFLKGDVDNGWLATPKIRLSVLHLGLMTTWPLARTEYQKIYLTPEGKMSRSPSTESGQVIYDSKNGKALFRYRIPHDMETTGYFIARLAVSCPSSDDMDLFAQVCCLRGRSANKQGVLTIRPDNMMVIKLLKLLHDWHVGLQGVGMLFHWGPAGQLRVSHAHQLSEHATSFEPLYAHTERIPLTQGEIRVVEIPLRPYGMFWRKDDVMELTIAGNPVLPFPIPGVKPLQGTNTGAHTIHCLDRGDDSSCLVVPST